ncbi:hypothetical protein GGS26DRAFT_391863 [Hypomontagnella submonticulosa]|nr:hypothetical protein GGS26DRAFT_391863 [Hypomontagnella submonticulosa]
MSNAHEPLGSWKWNDTALTAPEGEVSLEDPLEYTSSIVDRLRGSLYNDVRELIESKKNLTRLIELKTLRQHGFKTFPKIELDRQQKMSALAAYVTIDQSNSAPCKQCQNKKSRGPCTLCIAGSTNLFNGACTNCQFSSTASLCSFYKGKAGKSKKGKDGDDSEFDITVERLENATTRTLEIWEKMIQDELERRERRQISGSPNKRRRT